MDKDSLKHAAVSGMIWKFIERCSSQAVGLTVSIVLARLLTPDDFGLVAITMIFITLADAFISSGFGASLVQRGRYDKDEFSTMFWAGLMVSMVLYAVLFMAAPFIGSLYHSPDLSDVLRILGLRLPLAAYNSIQQAYVTQQMLFRKFFYSTLSGTIVSAGAGIYLALTGWGVWALVGQNIVMTVVDMLVLRYLVPWRPAFVFSWEKFQQLFSFGWRIMLTSFIGTLFDQLRGFLIGICYRPADLAFCNRGERIPQTIAGNISTSVDTVMFATLSKVKEDKVAFLQGLRKAMRLGSFLVIPLMAIMAGATSQFIEILLTRRWLEAAPYMQLICVQQMFGILSTLNMQSIKASGRADICLKLEVWKKPLYFGILLATMWISPLMMVAGNTFYGLLGLLINAYPNKKMLNYGFREQWRDVWGNFACGVAVFLWVWGIGYAVENVYVAFVVQVITGLVVYWLFAILFNLQGYSDLCHCIRNKRGAK